MRTLVVDDVGVVVDHHVCLWGNRLCPPAKRNTGEGGVRVCVRVCACVCVKEMKMYRESGRGERCARVY